MHWEGADVSTINLFPGAAADQPDDDLKQNFACPEAWNVMFGPGWVESRPGFAQVWTLPYGVLSMFHWTSEVFGNRLIYLRSDARVISRSLPSGTEVELLNLSSVSPTPISMTCEGFGKRVLMTFFGPLGEGVTEARVWDGDLVSGTPTIEKCFQGPLPTSAIGIAVTPTAALPNEVPVSAGPHRVGIVFVTRNGHSTGVSPTLADEFQPFEFLADGINAYQLTITPTAPWPAWAALARIVLTSKDNRESFFYVYSAADASVPAGTTGAVVIRFGISDIELTTGADSQAVLNIRNKVSTDSLGNGPIFPTVVAKSATRVAWLTQVADSTGAPQSGIFVSSQSDPQGISYDRHLIQHPAMEDITTIDWDSESLFFFGPNWTYFRTDNKLDPVEWPDAIQIPGGIGTKWRKGTAKISSSRRVVAHESGLYLFSGSSYDDVPLTDTQGKPEWEEINWAAEAGQLEVRVDTLRHLIMVRAPVGAGQATANKILTWDYTLGLDAVKVKFSVWDIGAGPGDTWQIGSMEFVQNSLSGRDELWVGRRQSVSGEVLRIRNKTIPSDVGNYYSDNLRGYASVYTTSIFRCAEEVQTWLAARLFLTGTGLVRLWWRAFKGSRFVEQASAVLTDSSPPIVRIKEMQSESAAVRISNNTVANVGWRLSRAQAKSNSVWTQRVG
jgi:hypothetical protein